MGGPIVRVKQIPTLDEKEALANANPPASAANPYVTSEDPRLVSNKGDTGVAGAKGDTGVGSLVAALDDLTDVVATSPVKDQVLKFNGTEWVPAAYNATFQFGISSFTVSEASPQLAGSGLWKDIAALTFSASYSNGPATSAYISKSGWSNLTLSAPFTSGVSAEAVNYPSVGSSVSFTLNASAGGENANSTRSIAFYNNVFWGLTTKTDTFLESDVEGLSNSVVSNTKGRTFSLTGSATEYVLYAIPSRLGTVTFWVGGFEGGFMPYETVSVTNANGFAENYYVYRGANFVNGPITVTVV